MQTHNISPKPQESEPATTADGDSLPGIRHLIAVASGKGGVGKSTVSVNLALALHQFGAKVGLVDADVFGPSLPVMLGLSKDSKPEASASGMMIPPSGYDVKVVSMGMLRDDDNPAMLRGPMVGKFLNSFISGVEWGELDAMILDLPPGTGDTQLTLAQSFPLSGAVIVTTPQDVSLNITKRGLRMFEMLHVPILGIIENMSGFTCQHCGEDTDIFRSGGGQKMAEELGVPFLGSIPLDADVVMGGDDGAPIVVSKPDSVAARAFREIANTLAGRLHGLQAATLKPFTWAWDSGAGEPAWVESAAHADGSKTTPVGMRARDARTLSILWADGTEHHLDVRDLRLACRCAVCIEETSGRALLDPATVPPDVSPRVISSVGNYAITAGWSDGHSTGIYSFGHLRTLGARNAEKSIEHV